MCPKKYNYEFTPGRPKISEESINSRLPSYLKIDYTTFKDQHTKARFVDEKYGECWGVPCDVFRRQKALHPDRERYDFLRKLEAQLPPFLKIKDETYIGLNKPVTLIDEVYGEWQQRIHHVIHRGMLPPARCKAEKLYKVDNTRMTEEEVNARIPNHLKVDYTTYVDTATKCRFIDIEYGELFAVPWQVFKSKQPLHPERLRLVYVDRIQNKLNALGSGLILDKSSFKNYKEKLLIIHPIHGEWWTTYSNVINGNDHPLNRKENVKRTCRERYGCDWSAQNREVHLKQTQSGKRIYHRTHWKTGKEILCTGRYERNVVDMMNSMKIDFEWQIPFKMHDGRVYICDMYVPKWNKYIEIKGFFYKTGKEKWNWFKSE